MGKWIAKLLVFTVTCLLVLELLFRFVFPACELPSSVQIPGGFLVADADYQQSGHFSLGRVPIEGYHWSINNDGWNSIFTYEPREGRRRPLIALIGDSSVEGHWCDVEDHIDSWLVRLLDGTFDVYAFGRGGMPLVQMVLLAEMVDSLYRPDLFVFMLGHEVVHGSLIPDVNIEYHYITPDTVPGGFTVMAPSTRVPSPFARTVMRSALVRYLRLHLMMEVFPLMDVQRLPRNLNADLTERELRDLLPAAVRFLLDRASRFLGDRRLLIVTDNWMDRNALYGEGETAASVVELIQRDMNALDEACRGFPCIGYLGTEPAFRQAWDSAGTSFSAADGHHLNAYGNYVVAEAILQRLREDGTLDGVLSGWQPPSPSRE